MTKLPTRESPPQRSQQLQPRHRNVYDCDDEYEFPIARDRARGDTISGKNGVAMKNHRVALGLVLLLAALGGTLHSSLALIAIDRLAQSEEYTDEMDKIETYRGFEIRAFEREQGRWRAEIRKADGSMLKILVGDSGHRTSITTSADTLTAETSIDEVKKAIDAGGLS